MSTPTAKRTRRSLKRKSFFMDERVLRRAKRALGVSTDAEAVRLSVARVVEMEEFWGLMASTHGVVGPEAFELP